MKRPRLAGIRSAWRSTASPPSTRPMSMLLISRRNRPSWIFSDRIVSMTSWSRLPKQSEMSPSMNHVVPVQVVGYLPQCGVTASAGAEPVRAVGELRLVVRLQEEADHFADQLVRPRRQAEGRSFPFFFGM